MPDEALESRRLNYAAVMRSNTDAALAANGRPVLSLAERCCATEQRQYYGPWATLPGE
jgi:hypothetical protein